MSLNSKNAWEAGRNVVGKSRSEVRANASPDLDIIEPEKEVRAMPNNTGNIGLAESASKNANQDNWKSIGELARAAVEKAVKK